jgi:hypothetical protein
LVFALGESDAAGEGLAAGLALFAGAVPVVPLGEGDVDGDEVSVFGEVELLPGSVAQPAANRIEKVVRRISALRLIKLRFGLLISLPHSARLKSEVMIARWSIRSNGCSHRSFAGISARAALKPSFPEEACTISERGPSSGGKPTFLTAS